MERAAFSRGCSQRPLAQGGVTNKFTKTFARIDDACALSRHVTVISAATLMEELGSCLESKELPTEVLPIVLAPLSRCEAQRRQFGKS